MTTTREQLANGLMVTVFHGMPDLHGIPAETVAAEVADVVFAIVDTNGPLATRKTGKDADIREWCTVNGPDYIAGGPKARIGGGHNKIVMIKDLRGEFAIGLKEAKDYVDSWFAGW